MENKRGNLVMFPGWKSRLEQSGLEALKEKRYKEAAEAFEPLVEYNQAGHDVITGLLMSWIELGHFDQAEELCQEQMKETIDQYYHYLHIYITILFQSSRYSDIIDLLDEVFESEDIPHQSRTQLWQMYEVSRKLLEDSRREQGKELSLAFKEALESDHIHKQWQTLDQLKKQDPHDYLEEFIVYLQEPAIHPMVKSSILEWFRDGRVDREVALTKFGVEMTIVPGHLSMLQHDYIMKQIQMRLGQVEQKNPTMYEMVNNLLFHYCYVRYPLFPDEEEVPLLVEALKQLGHEYLQLPYKPDPHLEEVDRYKSEIELCEQHYVFVTGS
ncbi:tetratricopeptide repeat protein [Halobacillus kuroshimensis]|uniref:Tetratricopeptide repeat protein n=1 Tax=Halobacillus kuroshimensis TaxID=302481 RepID=A0ABS3DZM4_9BACI|nr:tetratricopeptide repeat protein [Halobacillus kuroshimensis]MBN8236802.1 tetratricopeptide repeat protein [Halobacillus kuroshimensis]